MSEVRLEHLKPGDAYAGSPTQGDLMAACERHLEAEPGDGVVAIVVRDGATNTSTLLVVLADDEDYKPLPQVLGEMFWKGMETARAQMGVEAFFLRWRAGSTEAEGGAASEEDLLVKAVRARQKAENDAAGLAALPPGLAGVESITAAGRRIF